MEPLISETYAECYLKFDGLIVAISDGSTQSSTPHSLAKVKDEFVKFKLWAGNLGAAHAGRTYELSLDYRLREASFYKQQVLKLLNTLKRHLEQALSLIRHDRFSSTGFSSTIFVADYAADATVEDDPVEDDSPWEISSDSSRGAGSSSLQDFGGRDGPKDDSVKLLSSSSRQCIILTNSASGQNTSSEAGRISHSIQFTISCLSRLPIRKPAPLDRLTHRTSIDTSPYQHFDALYVQDKFPQLNVDVAMRLGKMTTRRRQLLRYRQMHYDRLSGRGTHQQSIFPARLPPKSESTEFVQGDVETVPERYETGSSQPTLRTKATTMKIDSAPAEDQLYAPSVPESKSSAASSYAGKELKVEFPPRPRADDGTDLENVECPYCGLLKIFKSTHQWRNHVLDDVQPYVCTFPDCNLSEHFFGSRDEWFRHESFAHRGKWHCNEDGHLEFELQEDFVRHMTDHHDLHLTDEKLQSSKDMFLRPMKSTSGQCNLCQKLSKRLKSHVTRHLQQIALFALPRSNETEGSGKAELDTHSSRFGDARKTLSQASFEDSDEGSSDISSDAGHDENVEEVLQDYDAQTSEDDHLNQVDVPDVHNDFDWDPITDKFAKARGDLPSQDPPTSAPQATQPRSTQQQSHAGTIGVCALDVKARSKPTRQILTRLHADKMFDIVIFGDKVILDEDVEDWPICDFLISYFSDGFPLDKAMSYVQLRKPFVVNDLRMQSVLFDRRLCLMILDHINVPTPVRLVISRDGGPSFESSDQAQYVEKTSGLRLTGPKDGTGGSTPSPRAVFLLDDGDTLSVDGQIIRKPFVEKPVNGEDHNINIYFPKSYEGGGGRRLFRKIASKSSEFDPGLTTPRCLTDTGSSYIYEQFLATENAEDLKVYTVGSECYGETRKSPVVDGVVRRNMRGKELRYVSSLSETEKQMALRVSRAFGQYVCGMDFLRTGSQSFVIDVKGWSLVKDNDSYYDRCAAALRSMFLAESALEMQGSKPEQQATTARPNFMPEISTPSVPEGAGSWILKGVVAAIRNANHVPKQRILFETTSDVIIGFVKDDEEVSLQEDRVVENIVQAVNAAIPIEYGDFEKTLRHLVGAYGQESAVKVKLVSREPSPELLRQVLRLEQRKAKEKLPIFELSWGGQPLHSARYQCQDLGASMRDEVFLLNKALLQYVRISSGGDKASKTSAQIWAASYLRNPDLPEDFITVRRDLLNDVDAAEADLKQLRRQFNEDFVKKREQTYDHLQHCYHRMKDNFETLRDQGNKYSQIQTRWCTGENPDLLRLRWSLIFSEPIIERAMFTHLADPYTAMKHDAVHNRQFLEWIFGSRTTQASAADQKNSPRLRRAPESEDASYFKLSSGTRATSGKEHGMSCLPEAYAAMKVLCEKLKPRLYGETSEEKLRTGLLIALPLIREIVQDLEELQASAEAKSFIYFTDQAHMHGLFNCLVEGGIDKTKVPPVLEFDDLAQIYFELWESPVMENEEVTAYKYSVRISVSPGCYTDDPLGLALDSKHTISSAPRKPMTGYVDWKDFVSTLKGNFDTVKLPKEFLAVNLSEKHETEIGVRNSRDYIAASDKGEGEMSGTAELSRFERPSGPS